MRAVGPGERSRDKRNSFLKLLFFSVFQVLMKPFVPYHFSRIRGTGLEVQRPQRFALTYIHMSFTYVYLCCPALMWPLTLAGV